MFTHTCTHCESSFKRKDNLKQHMFWKWLSEKRSFRPILLFTAHCDKATFTRLDNLQQHMFWKWLSEKRGLSATLAISNFGYWKNGDYQQLWLSEKWWFVRVKSHHPTLCSSHSMRYQKFSIGRDIFRYDGTLYLKDFDYSIGVTALKKPEKFQSTYGRNYKVLGGKKRRHQDHVQVDT